VDASQTSGGELSRESVEPRVYVIGAQLLELSCPDQRYDVLLGEDAIGVDRALVAPLEALREPVVDGVCDRVAI
jgi:hypothetical protein